MAETPDLSAYIVHNEDMAQELDVESHAPYMRVWLILAVLTAVEYFYAMFFKDHFPLLVSGLVSLALVKASMVGWYFMHLKFERKWVYILIIPACVMAIFLTLMLTPDLAMKPTAEENSGEEGSWVAPASGIESAPLIRLACLPGLAGDAVSGGRYQG
ncbi:MAG: cytochrome C oxidase subunit IV family protein [Isosphaeraceae bacterium]